MNSPLESMLATIVQDLSGKEFTKDDLMKIICKTDPTTKGNTNTETINSESENQYTPSPKPCYATPLEFAMSVKDARTSFPAAHLRCNPTVWIELYENEEYCKKILEKDMKQQIMNINKWTKEIKCSQNEEKEQVRYNALTKEARDIYQEARKGTHKQHIIRRFKLDI